MLTLNELLITLFFSSFYIYIIYWKFHKINPFIILFHERIIMIILIIFILLILFYIIKDVI